MSITIELPARLEEILQDEATRTGKTTGELALERLAYLYTGSDQKDQDTIIDAVRARNRAIALEQSVEMKALFDQWNLEDATDDEEELKRRDEDNLRLMHAMNEGRKDAGERIPYPELEEAA